MAGTGRDPVHLIAARHCEGAYLAVPGGCNGAPATGGNAAISVTVRNNCFHLATPRWSTLACVRTFIRTGTSQGDSHERHENTDLHPDRRRRTRRGSARVRRLGTRPRA